MGVETIEATYRITTPMFCGGADPKNAELRLASFKGVLRFWWRALAWKRIGNDLEQLARDEAELFGSTDQQAKVMMRLTQKDVEFLPVGHKLTDANTGLVYLGYGLMPAYNSKKNKFKAGEIKRAAIKPGGVFTVNFRFGQPDSCRGISEQLRNDLLQTIELLGVVGAMGSRSRKGWGSLVGERLIENGKVKDFRKITQLVADPLDKKAYSKQMPNWTAFSCKTRCVQVNPKDNRMSPMKLFNHIARELVRYRCWGFGSQHQPERFVLGNVPSEFNFVEDHDLIKGGPTQWTDAPFRVAFGLPHNYFTGLSKESSKVEVNIKPKDHERRGSPMFIHIGRSEAYLLLLPSRFLPSKPSVNIKAKSGESKTGVTIQQRDKNKQEMLWWPIECFLDRLCGFGNDDEAMKRYGPFMPSECIKNNIIKEPLVGKEVF